MNRKLLTRSAALVSAAGIALAMTACSSEPDDTADDGNAPEETQEEEPAEDTAAEPFGEGCSAVPEDGDGSFEGMAADPVATAASNNPALSTLVTAVGEADLVDTLNSEENLTVFAPSNDAFDKIPEEDLNALLEDKDALTDVLTYHVLGETVTPDQLGADGPFASLQGEEVTASGSGEDFTINEESKVVCGNVQTSNATVYIVDTVLMPPAAK